MNDDEATLNEIEPHPCAEIAREFILSIPFERLCMFKEAIYSTALSGNRMAQICASTLTRLDNKEPVSDRYFMGLAWLLAKMYQEELSVDDHINHAVKKAGKNLVKSLEK